MSRSDTLRSSYSLETFPDHSSFSLADTHEASVQTDRASHMMMRSKNRLTTSRAGLVETHQSSDGNWKSRFKFIRFTDATPVSVFCLNSPKDKIWIPNKEQKLKPTIRGLTFVPQGTEWSVTPEAPTHVNTKSSGTAHTLLIQQSVYSAKTIVLTKLVHKKMCTKCSQETCQSSMTLQRETLTLSTHFWAERAVNELHTEKLFFFFKSIHIKSKLGWHKH